MRAILDIISDAVPVFGRVGGLGVTLTLCAGYIDS